MRIIIFILHTFILSSLSLGSSNESRAEKIKEIKLLIKLEKVSDRVYRAAKTGYYQGRDEFLRGQKGISAARIEKANEIYDELFDKTFNDNQDEWNEKIHEHFVEIYDLNYSHDEIKEIVKFYQTPTGQKVINKLDTNLKLGMSATAAILEWYSLKLNENVKKVKKSKDSKI